MTPFRVGFRVSVGSLLGTLAIAARAPAQDLVVAPPPDDPALVSAPAGGPAPPAKEDKLDGTTATLSAGGMLTTGNSRQLALTGQGSLETRFDSNGLGASVIGNYGRGGPPGVPVETTAESVQGRLRYDRYLVERLSLFVINTLRHDRFQGLDLRYNLDPGAKYLFVNDEATKLWGELGYDLQFDVRRNDARTVVDDDGNPVIDPATGLPQRLDKTQVDHSARAFLGNSHAFNEAVTFSAGVEYLQSFVESERSRLNFDALFAAKVGAGLALGVGFSARFDNAPLPGKKKLDTSTTLSLIYAFSNLVEPEPPPPCPPCPAYEPPPAPVPPPAPPAESTGTLAPPETAPAPQPLTPPPGSTPGTIEPLPAPAPAAEPPPPAPGTAPAPGR